MIKNLFYWENKSIPKALSKKGDESLAYRNYPKGTKGEKDTHPKATTRFPLHRA